MFSIFCNEQNFNNESPTEKPGWRDLKKSEPYLQLTAEKTLARACKKTLYGRNSWVWVGARFVSNSYFFSKIQSFLSFFEKFSIKNKKFPTSLSIHQAYIVFVLLWRLVQYSLFFRHIFVKNLLLRDKNLSYTKHLVRSIFPFDWFPILKKTSGEIFNRWWIPSFAKIWKII